MKNGDVVIRVNNDSTSGGPKLGARGTIVHWREWDCGVDWDERWDHHSGHNCEGKAKEGHGWYVQHAELKLALDVVSKKHPYKVGDKIVPCKELVGNCSDIFHDTDYIEITDVTTNSVGEQYLYYRVFSKGKQTGSCSGHEKFFNEIPMKMYSEPSLAVDYALPTDMTATAVQFNAAPTTTARIGWMDEPVFIPKGQSGTTTTEKDTDYTDFKPAYKSSTKYKPKADNIRKLMGLRNHKNRSKVSV